MRPRAAPAEGGRANQHSLIWNSERLDSVQLMVRPHHSLKFETTSCMRRENSPS